MSVVAAIRDLLAKGFSIEQALTAAEAFENTAPTRTARQDRNSRYYQRKASEKRLKASETSNSDETVLNKTPLVRGDARGEDNLLTKKITGKEEREEKTRVARPGFLQFWDIFPNKVGKRDAEVAFSKALQRADLETILGGVRRYAAKTDDRPWCNPTTFLNQDRWDDIPAAQPQRPATGPPRHNGRLTVMDAYHDIAREQGWTDEPTDIPGNHDDAQRLSAERGSGHEGVVVDLRRRLDGSFGSGGL